MYVLYEEFNQKISYDVFKKCYNHLTYTNLIPKVEPYPYNFEFSCQFNSGKLEYDEVVYIREEYAKGTYWKTVYELFKDRFANDMSFWRLYSGLSYKLVMPEVFTEENKAKHRSLKNCGANNGRAKLTVEDVLEIRRLYDIEKKKIEEIHLNYPQVALSTIKSVVKRKSWYHI